MVTQVHTQVVDQTRSTSEPTRQLTTVTSESLPTRRASAFRTTVDRTLATAMSTQFSAATSLSRPKETDVQLQCNEPDGGVGQPSPSGNRLRGRRGYRQPR